MKTSDLLSFCRYYKGEEECPFASNNPNSLCWWYEQKWVEFTIKARGDEDSDESKVLSSYLAEYIRAGMREFEKTDDTPIALKALLFNRYYHWNVGGDFKKWYKEVYKA